MNSINIYQPETFVQKSLILHDEYSDNPSRLIFFLSSTLSLELHLFPSSPLYREFFALIKLEK